MVEAAAALRVSDDEDEDVPTAATAAAVMLAPAPPPKFTASVVIHCSLPTAKVGHPLRKSAPWTRAPDLVTIPDNPPP